MLTDEKIRELATLYIVEKGWNTIPEHDANDNLGMWYARCKLAYIAGANAAREEMMKSANHEALKSKFFAKFGFGQCDAIWEFFAPHLTDNGK